MLPILMFIWWFTNIMYFWFLMDCIFGDEEFNRFCSKENGTSLGFILISILCIPTIAVVIVIGAVLLAICSLVVLLTVITTKVMSIRIGGKKDVKKNS